MKTLAIIPSRYASSRFPGKPLINIAGKSMIQRVYEQAKKARNLDHVIVATDDQRIFEAVKNFNGEVIMTRSDHESGTDRCAELASQFPEYELIINIQGDEPFIQPEQIDCLIEKAKETKSFQIGTMIKSISEVSELHNPNTVKVVIDQAQKALYFSRQAIPYLRGIEAKDWLKHHQFYKHIGMYIFRNSILKEISQLKRSSLELAESLEQLRWLENGYSIKTVETNLESFGIDAPEDLEQLKGRNL